jgi:uncharacterized membrane protein YdjX (TVP38/TMEM64 family)
LGDTANHNRVGFSTVWRWAIGAVLILLLAGFYAANREHWNLTYLAERQTDVVDSLRTQPLLLLAAGYLLYVAVTGISLPGAAVLTLLYGWLLQQAWPGAAGLIAGIVLVSFASTSGASVAFLFSRFLFRDAIHRRFAAQLAGFEEALSREGAFYLFSLRLIPAVPFFVINLVMGLTPIRLKTFWWVSQLGMLPATCIFVYAGSVLPDAQQIIDHGAGGIFTPKLIAVLVLLGLLPLAAKKIVGAIRSRRNRTPGE